MATTPGPGEPAETPAVDDLVARMDDGAFEDWYREREFRQNVQQGKHYFNGPSRVPEPERHAPGSLLQCHRKRYYAQLNAPKESGPPRGIFWFGSAFEERVVIEFLRDVADVAGVYVQNDVWVDYEVETDAGTLRIKGATDPVVVEADGTPLLPTEIKTSSSVEYVDEPREHHLAQAHAYLYGLSEEYGDVDEAVLFYADRETFETRAFHITFDEAFWQETVLAWAADHTEYRLDGKLPPAEPYHGWECSYCDYAHRCGQEGETDASDYPPEGFVPGLSYPRERVAEHLEAHDDATLTATLAEAYPDLAAEYDTVEWTCEVCSYRVPSSDLDDTISPQCPECWARGLPAWLVPESEVSDA